MLYGNRLIHCSLFSLSLLFFSFSISSPFLQPFSHSPIYPYLPFCVPIFLLLVSRLPILYPAICPSGNHSKGSGHITLLFHFLAPSVRNIFFFFFYLLSVFAPSIRNFLVCILLQQFFFFDVVMEVCDTRLPFLSYALKKKKEKKYKRPTQKKKKICVR